VITSQSITTIIHNTNIRPIQHSPLNPPLFYNEYIWLTRWTAEALQANPVCSVFLAVRDHFMTDKSRPQKGSFPLDHYAECKHIMTRYLACLKAAGGSNDQCREEAKGYLACRMQHNLMAQESMKNLGFADDKEGDAKNRKAGGQT